MTFDMQATAIAEHADRVIKASNNENNEPCTPNSKASSGGGMEQGLKAVT